METAILLFMISIMCFIGAWISFKNQANTIQSINKVIDNLKNTYDKVIPLGYRNDELSYVGFNNKTRCITIKTKGTNNTINYNDIVKVELIENGRTTMSIGNVIGGAVLAGGTGAIIGAMNKNEKIISRKVKFSLDNFDNPSYEINLLDTGKTAECGIDIIAEANKLMDTVKYIVDNKQKI
ncbi:hypothetical protein SDC9_48729 [bioreactor metagenome]|uniref:Uncharacterized protein n=1 Tax=bioreactor metagenome TaxID=1076179 RepID=A0A644WF78_9ZZZZ